MPSILYQHPATCFKTNDDSPFVFAIKDETQTIKNASRNMVTSDARITELDPPDGDESTVHAEVHWREACGNNLTDQSRSTQSNPEDRYWRMNMEANNTAAYRLRRGLLGISRAPVGGESNDEGEDVEEGTYTPGALTEVPCDEGEWGGSVPEKAFAYVSVPLYAVGQQPLDCTVEDKSNTEEKSNTKETPSTADIGEAALRRCQRWTKRGYKIYSATALIAGHELGSTFCFFKDENERD